MKKMSYNKAMLAQLNKRIVLEMIRVQGPINKAEIARQASLSIPTVMKITEEFERQKLIRTVGKGESTGGKRPDMLEFVADAFYVAGVDIGRHNVKMVIMDMEAAVLSQNCFQTTKEDVQNPEAFLEKIRNGIESLIIESKIKQSKLMGIGIGMPGILDKEKKVVMFSPDFNWVDVPIHQIFQERFSCKVIVENSNRALALGEYSYGAAKSAEYMLCINLGYGIGAAIIENGELLKGSSGTSGELGHMIMDPYGPVCDCGNRGCLEALSSGNAIAKKMEQEILSGKESVHSVSDRRTLEAEDVFEAARSGDMLSKEIIDEAMGYLGIAVASCINLLDPDTIILAGGLTKSQDIFFEKLQDDVEKHKMRYSGRNVKMKIGTLGVYGTAIGAATILIRQFIENGGEL